MNDETNEANEALERLEAAAARAGRAGRPRRTMKSRLLGLIPILIVIGLIVGWQMRGKAKASDEVRGQLVEIVERIPSYGANSAAFDGLVDRAHEPAFDIAYSYGGRRTSSRFDADRYMGAAFSLMMQYALESGRSDLANDLNMQRARLGIPSITVVEE